MKNFTKKIIGAVLLSVIGFTLFAEEIKEKAYLEVEIDGKTQGKWFLFFELVEYDRNGNKVYEKSRYTGELWNEYDKNGNLIHKNSSDGKEWWYEYDKNGNMIHDKRLDGKEYWYEYDKNGNMIHQKGSDGYEDWYEYEYDKNGNMIHKKNSDGVIEYWYEYDKNGNMTYRTMPDLSESWYEYDKNGNVIYWKNWEGHYKVLGEWWYEYKWDKNGNLIQEEVSSDTNIHFIYIHILEYWDDGKTLKKDITYCSYE